MNSSGWKDVKIRTFESRIAEEYPAEANEMESQDDRKEFLNARTAVGLRTMQQAAQELMDSQCRTVQSAPKDEVPRCSVPQSA